MAIALETKIQDIPRVSPAYQKRPEPEHSSVQGCPEPNEVWFGLK